MGEQDDANSGYIGFSLNSSTESQSSGYRKQRNFHHNQNRNNRSRPGFGYQQQQQNNSNYFQNNRDRYNQGHNRSNQSFGNRKNDSYNVLDYIHPSMWEDPWAHLVRKREYEEPKEVDSPEKRIKLSDTEEQPAEEAKEGNGGDGSGDSSAPSSPEGLKIYD